MVETITIDFDQKCRCGDKGVCPNGLCLKCNTNEMLKQKGKGNMKQLDREALERAKKDLCTILEENWEDIVQMRNIAAVNYSKAGNDGKFSFKVACSIVQMPKGDSIDIKVGISCASPLKDETEFFCVDLQPNLPLDD